MKKLLIILASIISVSAMASIDSAKNRACDNSLNQLIVVSKLVRAAEDSLKQQKLNDGNRELINMSEDGLQMKRDLLEMGKEKARVACAL